MRATTVLGGFLAALALGTVAAPAAIVGTLRADDADPAGRGAASKRPGPAKEDPPKGDVDRAVARGVQWLLAEQQRDGGFGTTAGETGLALWALRHCGVAQDDKAALRAAERLERDLPDGTSYGTSLGVCGLLAHDAVKHRERIQKGVDALVRGQCENGQWTYLCKAGGKQVGDNSNTQCAVLALGAAKLRGFKVPDAPMRTFLEFAVRTQNADGGWGYAEKQRRESYGSMTAGILMGWALATASLSGTDPRKVSLLGEEEAKRSILRLAHQYKTWVDEVGRPLLPGGSVADRRFGESSYYSLWSVERAGVLCDFERLGAAEWYPPGARWILGRQDARGYWTDSRIVADTAWALLFLRRGMEAVITPRGNELGPTTGSKPGDPPPPGPPPAGK